MFNRSRIFIWQFIIVAITIIFWENIGRHSQYWFFLIGSPTAILRELWRLITKDNLLYHFAITGCEAVIGLCLGTIIGSMSGLLLWYSDTAARIVRPFVLILGSLPIFAFAPLMIVWFGVDLHMKIALATFSTVFVAFTQGYRGANLVENDFVNILRGMDATRWQIFKIVIVPGSLDWVLSSMRLNIGFGLLGAFIGEFIAADRGLGFLILRAGGLYNVPRAIAAGVGIVTLAFFLDAIGRIVETNRYTLVQWISMPRVIWPRK